MKKIKVDPAYVRELMASQARQKSDGGLVETIAALRAYLSDAPDPAMAESDAAWLVVLKAEYERRTGGGVIVAALFVAPRGPYVGLHGVEIWDESRDARRYDGSHPVVAHPPCERWGRYWHGGPSARVRRVKGDDGGCFASALASVRRCGGVLEHPAASSAWAAHGLIAPPRAGGWVVADWDGGWTCCADQGHYGHLAQKATWLYAVGIAPLPLLRWGKSANRVRLDDGFHSAEERRRKIRTGTCQRLSHRQRADTPIEFRDLLLAMARLVSEDYEQVKAERGRQEGDGSYE